MPVTRLWRGLRYAAGLGWASLSIRTSDGLRAYVSQVPQSVKTTVAGVLSLITLALTTAGIALHLLGWVAAIATPLSLVAGIATGIAFGGSRVITRLRSSRQKP